jgi:hypothetical protein
MEEESNYKKYRGKCKEFCEKEIEKNPLLILVRGYYYCPIWNKEEPHWWLIDDKNNIIDPTVLQFPSKGFGEYIPFNGFVNCSECGKEIKEEEADIDGNYCFCSNDCHLRFVGLEEYIRK